MQSMASLVRTRQWTATAAEAEHKTRGRAETGEGMIVTRKGRRCWPDLYDRAIISLDSLLSGAGTPWRPLTQSLAMEMIWSKPREM